MREPIAVPDGRSRATWRAANTRAASRGRSTSTSIAPIGLERVDRRRPQLGLGRGHERPVGEIEGGGTIGRHAVALGEHEVRRRQVERRRHVRRQLAEPVAPHAAASSTSPDGQLDLGAEAQDPPRREHVDRAVGEHRRAPRPSRPATQLADAASDRVRRPQRSGSDSSGDLVELHARRAPTRSPVTSAAPAAWKVMSTRSSIAPRRASSSDCASARQLVGSGELAAHLGADRADQQRPSAGEVGDRARRTRSRPAAPRITAGLCVAFHTVYHSPSRSPATARLVDRGDQVGARAEQHDHRDVAGDFEPQQRPSSPRSVASADRPRRAARRTPGRPRSCAPTAAQDGVHPLGELRSPAPAPACRSGPSRWHADGAPSSRRDRRPAAATARCPGSPSRARSRSSATRGRRAR